MFPGERSGDHSWISPPLEPSVLQSHAAPADLLDYCKLCGLPGKHLLNVLLVSEGSAPLKPCLRYGAQADGEVPFSYYLLLGNNLPLPCDRVSGEQRGDQKDPGNRSLWADFKSVVELKAKPRLASVGWWVRSSSRQLLLRKGAEEKLNPGLELSA